MSTRLAHLDSLVHPHQIEVQEFDSYALIIDSRRAEAYREDHIPGAINVQANAQEAAPAAGALVAGEAQPPSLYALATHLQRLSPGATVLVYCDRGGLDSQVWARPLEAAGYRVDVLAGGWINYRRWVAAGLEVLPRALTFRRLGAPPAGGLCSVFDQLAALGEQVLDLTSLAGQRMVPGVTLAGDEPPSQAAFDTTLFGALRRLDPRRTVWVRDGSSRLGELTIPPSLRDALQRSPSLWLEVPLPVRVQAWIERLQDLGIEVTAVLHGLAASKPPPEGTALEQWHALERKGRLREVLAAIIDGYIDPHSDRMQWAGFAHVMQLPSLSVDAVKGTVAQWRAN